MGNFGQMNLGNEATLLATLSKIREGAPGVETLCICTDAAVASVVHGISALPIHAQFIGAGVMQGSIVAKFLRKTLLGIPAEFRRWLIALRTLRDIDTLIVPGTQFLSDNLTGPWTWPYWTFRWAIAARLCGCKLLFVSVGVGPLTHPLSRFFVRSALRLAAFRSYRDTMSKKYVGELGVAAADDPIYPDLAFSLSVPKVPEPVSMEGRRPTIAVGVKDFHGQYGADGKDPSARQLIYQRYLTRVAAFLAWLLDRGYLVRLVLGDITFDTQVLADVRRILAQQHPESDQQYLICEPIESLDQLLRQLAGCDAVVSPRFHNIVFGLLLNKPVLAISYHAKFSALLESSRLARLNVSIEDADLESVTERFREVEENRAILKQEIERNVAVYRAALDEQYRYISRFITSDDRPSAS